MLYFFGGLAHGQLHLDGIVQNGACQLLNLLGHGGTEQDGLAVLGQILLYLQDVIAEAHVKHAVRLVQNKEGDFAQIHVAEADVADEPARSGDDDIRPLLHSLLLLFVADAVVSAIYGHTADAVQIVAEALHGLVNLLRQFSRGAHDDTVDGILGESAILKQAQDRQKISRSLSGSGLRNAHHVPSFQDAWDGMFLDWSGFYEVHVVQCV